MTINGPPHGAGQSQGWTVQAPNVAVPDRTPLLQVLVWVVQVLPHTTLLDGYAVVVSPLFGLAVGGFAGYYRRFLYLSNPNARRNASQRPSKPAAKRR